MKISELLELAEESVTHGVLKMYTPETTIYSHLRKGFSEIADYFPLSKVITLSSDQNYVDIPQDEDVNRVIDVVCLEPKQKNFEFGPEELFFATSRYMDVTHALEDWIMFQRNMRAYRVFSGRSFEWQQSKQNRRRIYVDDVPSGSLGFTIKFTVDHVLPDTLAELTEKDGEGEPTEASLKANINLPEPQSTYLLRYMTAIIKQSEGGILKRFRPSGQAVETDGAELSREGKEELEAVRRELKERGFSLLSF